MKENNEDFNIENLKGQEGLDKYIKGSIERSNDRQEFKVDYDNKTIDFSDVVDMGDFSWVLDGGKPNEENKEEKSDMDINVNNMEEFTNILEGIFGEMRKEREEVFIGDGLDKYAG